MVKYKSKKVGRVHARESKFTSKTDVMNNTLVKFIQEASGLFEDSRLSIS